MTINIRIMATIGAIVLTGTLSTAPIIAGTEPATAEAVAPDGGDLFGLVTIPRPTHANGAVLAPGTYSVRITEETSDEERWVEFVAGTRVAGRELATVIPTSEIRTVAKLRPPQAGEVRVDTLKEADYLRVWINDAGTHYLLHLPIG